MPVVQGGSQDRVVATAAVGFERGSPIACVDGGGGRFRNPSLSGSVSIAVRDAAAIVLASDSEERLFRFEMRIREPALYRYAHSQLVSWGSAAGRGASRLSAAAGCAERTICRSPVGHDHVVNATTATVATR
jgi:hypothetical protein